VRAIITVVGKDKIGIIAGITSVLSKYKVNILDISQTILQEYFTMIMLVDLSHMDLSLEELKQKLEEKGESLGVSVRIQHEEIFQSMHRI
jgi:ACT domain.